MQQDLHGRWQELMQLMPGAPIAKRARERGLAETGDGPLRLALIVGLLPVISGAAPIEQWDPKRPRPWRGQGAYRMTKKATDAYKRYIKAAARWVARINTRRAALAM